MNKMSCPSPADILAQRRAEIEATQLTEEEVKEAIKDAKVRKWSRERRREYWESLERGKK